MLQCADATFYTGITTNLPRRMEQHAAGTGAKYTRGRGPHRLVFTEIHFSKTMALKREWAIKNLSRTQKLQLVAADSADKS